MSVRALSSVSGGPDTAYGPTMRAAAGLGAGAADGWNARGASSARSRSATALSDSRATAAGAPPVTRCLADLFCSAALRVAAMLVGAAEGAATVSVTPGVVSAVGVASRLDRLIDPRYRPAPSASTTVAAHA